jgi:hypothetical protein
METPSELRPYYQYGLWRQVHICDSYPCAEALAGC